MGKAKLTIHLERPQAVYYGGEIVSGQAIIETDEEIKTKEIRLEVSGTAFVSWSEGTSKHRRHYAGNEIYFSNIIILCKDDPESFMLKPGQYQYPFQLELPPDLPSSFEYGHARVRYGMQLVIDRPWHTDDAILRVFTVLSHLDLNQLPNALTPVAIECSTILCCCCCKTGPISASLKIERSGFVPGERIPVHAVCVNKSNRVMEATRVSLWQGITCYATAKTRRFVRQLVNLERPPIQAGDTDVWQGEGVPVPPCAPTGLPGCSIIGTDYFVLFDVDPSGPSLDLQVQVPVVIGTIPLAQFLSNHGLGNASGTPFHPDYPSLPAPSYETFNIPGEFAAEVSGNEGGIYSPSYPVYTWISPTPAVAK